MTVEIIRLQEFSGSAQRILIKNYLVHVVFLFCTKTIIAHAPSWSSTSWDNELSKLSRHGIHLAFHSETYSVNGGCSFGRSVCLLYRTRFAWKFPVYISLSMNYNVWNWLWFVLNDSRMAWRVILILTSTILMTDASFYMIDTEMILEWWIEWFTNRIHWFLQHSILVHRFLVSKFIA